MTANELARIKAARDRNRAAMEQEKAEAGARRREEADRQARAEVAGRNALVQMAQIALTMPGRALTRRHVDALNDIIRRNS